MSQPNFVPNDQIQEPEFQHTLIMWLKNYFFRFLGQKGSNLSVNPSKFAIYFWSFVGSFSGIALVTGLSYNSTFFDERDVPVFIGSLGATAILIYGSIDSPLAQPKNTFFGHLISAFIGVSINRIFSIIHDDPNNDTSHRWLICAFAVSLSMFFMQLTKTVHPPGGATALIAVSGGPKIYNLGFLYLIAPTLLGVSLMFVVALLLNNLQRKYPLYWWDQKSKVKAVNMLETKEIEVQMNEDHQHIENDKNLNEKPSVLKIGNIGDQPVFLHIRDDEDNRSQDYHDHTISESTLSPKKSIQQMSVTETRKRIHALEVELDALKKLLKNFDDQSSST
ncbi:hypothetical protein G9A89_022954 [Geosiphon pyriformis]|nr:hypothetical protein G9A89_022954 [Geosiphon pyriformis]